MPEEAEAQPALKSPRSNHPALASPRTLSRKGKNHVAPLTKKPSFTQRGGWSPAATPRSANQPRKPTKLDKLPAVGKRNLR